MSKSKKYNIKRRNTTFNKSKKGKKNMKGGFAPDETQHLLDNGFKQNQIDQLSGLNISIDIINQAIEYYNNNFNAHEIILDIAKNLHANLPPLNNIGLDTSTSSSVSEPQPQNNNNISQSSDSGSLLNLDDLQVPEGHEIPQDANDQHNIDMNQSLDLSDATSMPDESMNSTLNSTANDITNTSSTNNSLNSSTTGGKRRVRHTKKRGSNLKHRKTHRILKGGRVYGNGYGANCNEPNYSIYNTSLTKLFPYRPEK